MIPSNLLKQFYISAAKFLEPLCPDEMYATLVEEAKKLCHAQWGAIWIPEKDGFVSPYYSMHKVAPMKPRPNGIIAEVYRTNKALLYSKKNLKSLLIHHPQFAILPIKSVVVIPVSYGVEVMGVLCLFSKKEDKFSFSTIQMLHFFCSLAHLALRKTQLLEEVKKALEQRDLFISLAAHELKTPLTTALLYGDMLKEKIPLSRPESQLISSVVKALRRINQILNEFLHVEQIQKGQLQYRFERCNMFEIISSAVEECKRTYPFHNIVLNNKGDSIPGVVNADPYKLFQAISNLLSNAAKYSPPGKQITITMSSHNEKVTFSIQDEGKGIHEGDLPHIFDKFFRGKNSNGEGMGLGLFLIKDIIDHHQGTITVNSMLKKGTTVSISLPRAI